MEIIVYVSIDISVALIMFLLGFYFYKSKGNAANYLTGYNMRPDDERKRYNETEMCVSYGKRMMIMAIPFLAGAVIDVFSPGTGSIIAWGSWIVLFALLLLDRLKRER